MVNLLPKDFFAGENDRPSEHEEEEAQEGDKSEESDEGVDADVSGSDPGEVDDDGGLARPVEADVVDDAAEVLVGVLRTQEKRLVVQVGV